MLASGLADLSCVLLSSCPLPLNILVYTPTCRGARVLASGLADLGFEHAADHMPDSATLTPHLLSHCDS